MNQVEQKQVADTILEQLGGVRFVTMTGAKNLLALDEGMGGLSFRLPRYAGVKVNYVRINLNHNDLYDLEFGRISNGAYSILKSYWDIYSDQLQEVFTEQTGLYTKL